MFLFYSSVLPQAFTVDHHHSDTGNKTNQTKGSLSHSLHVLLKKLQLWSEMRVRWQVKVHAYTQVETSTKLSKSNDIMLKQPALIALPILLMAWMRSFLSKNWQSLHTHSAMLEKQWVILQHSLRTHFQQQTLLHTDQDSSCSGMPFGASLENISSSLKHTCLEQLCFLGLQGWILFLAFSSL